MEESVKYKLKLNHLTGNYKTMKLLLGFGCINGKNFVQLNIKLIDIAKQLLLLNLEQGGDAHIYPELSQRNMPMSLKYYDPILKII
tara:strand:- start:49 stop:306 length:258 start_codon:yes stop_codon:yes gene_type:complete